MPERRSDLPFFPQHDHQICISKALKQAEALCSKRKARLTPLRRRVLELLWQSHRPMGAYELLGELQAEGSAAPPTIYRALEFLQQLGLVHRIASLNAYLGCNRPEQPHTGQFLICRSCQASSELNAHQVAASIVSASTEIGFVAEAQTVEIFGLCQHCQGA
jgi:Fur family zinc uptake transcriptional regulator